MKSFCEYLTESKLPPGWNIIASAKKGIIHPLHVKALNKGNVAQFYANKTGKEFIGIVTHKDKDMVKIKETEGLLRKTHKYKIKND